MLPLEIRLAILGVYLALFFWICIGVFTWIWWAPFKAMQKFARAGYHSSGLASLPNLLITTLIMLCAQGFWCIFTLCEIITLFATIDSEANPQQSKFLLHALVLWFMVTAICLAGGLTLAVTIITGIRLINSSSLQFPDQTEDVESVDVGRQTRRYANLDDTEAVDSGYYSGYGPFMGPIADQSSDDYSSDSFWASDTNYWTGEAPTTQRQARQAHRYYQNARQERLIQVSHAEPFNCFRRPERVFSGRFVGEDIPLLTSAPSLSTPPMPPLPPPMNGPQSELSDADDEIDPLE